MASNSSDKEREQQLLEAGNKLLNPPSSVDELLSLIDQVENCLSKVEQSPLKSMQNALSPSQNALVTDQLFRHSNIDVKVAVAACISEITRITAPNAPYDDDRMKEVFQLIVSSFENLDDKSSQSYVKRASILETVAKVRSCVVMLDLECDALIIEMFQHFFKAIRDYHPENVFSSMETIMSLVLEESEDISVELLSPLLASVKRGDEEVLPVARKLGEKVLERCAMKVKPYLIQTVKSLGISFDDYSDIVGSICQEISGDENKVNGEETTEVATPEQAEPANDKCPKSAVSNGVTLTEEDDSLADSDSMKKQEEDNHTDQLKSMDLPSNAEPDISNADKVANTESKAEQTSKKSEKSPTKLAQPSETSRVDSEKEAEELPDDIINSEDVPGSPHKDQPVEEAISSENVKETGSQPPSPKALEGDSVPVVSPSVCENLPDESVSKKGGRAKKKESLNKHSAPSSADVPNKVSDGTSDSESKLHKCSGKKAPAGTSSEDKTPVKTDASKKESDTTGKPEAKPLKQSSKKVDTLKESDTTNEPEAKARKQTSKKVDTSKKESDASSDPEAKLPKQAASKKADMSKKVSNTTDESEAKSQKQSSKKVDGSSINNNDGSILKQIEDKKRQGHGKAVSEKHVTKDDDKEKTPSTKSPAKSAKEEHHLDETPVTSTKRKRPAGDEKASDIKEFDENVVGSKVKVWWPKDRQYYEGKVVSFDPIKKKHKVLYTDGDEEMLILKRQKFEFVGDDSESNKEEAARHSSPETSSETPLKKRMKTSSDKSTKQGKGDGSSKRPEDSPARYQDEYSKLRTWAYSSLDLYKHELLRVLYPVFVHCYMDIVAKGHIQDARNFFNSFHEDHKMMHSRDLQKLEGVLSPSHLEEMEFAHTLRQSKVNIKICQYSDELIMQYLRKSKSSIILGIVNEHINFQVSPGQPISISDDPDAVTLIGSSQDAANQINKKEIHWGLLEDSLEERFEKTGGFLSDSEKTEGETKEGDMDENKKRSMDGGKQASIKKSKKDKAASATAKAVRLEANTVPAAPRVKPELPLPVMQADVEQSILEDLRNRVQLSSATLPSVSFYTFINTHNSLNCSSISHDGSLVAGGFSDSSLKVWDMAKLGQQAGNSILQDENDAAPSEHVSGPNSGKRSYTLFQGHSGPVHSASFSPLGDFVLSSSADTTVRLWSTELNANLVCYKGHNYPVWDVQFSPMGHYFASASHDRTARIWSVDRIQPLRIMAGHLSDVDCVQWHANCNYIATGSSDKTVRLWDVQSGECVRIFIGHRSMILSLAMSPDGRYMASGDEDGTIMMWDLSSGRCISPLMGHHSCVWSLAFSCESSLLASGSADCTVKLWDVTTSTKPAKKEENKTGNTHRMRLLKTLPTKSTPVSTLRFSRRNLLFAAGALSKSQ